MSQHDINGMKLYETVILILSWDNNADMVVVLQGPPGLPGFPGNPGLPVSSFSPHNNNNQNVSIL